VNGIIAREIQKDGLIQFYLGTNVSARPSSSLLMMHTLLQILVVLSLNALTEFGRQKRKVERVQTRKDGTHHNPQLEDNTILVAIVVIKLIHDVLVIVVITT